MNTFNTKFFLTCLLIATTSLHAAKPMQRLLKAHCHLFLKTAQPRIATGAKNLAKTTAGIATAAVGLGIGIAAVGGVMSEVCDTVETIQNRAAYTQKLALEQQAQIVATAQSLDEKYQKEFDAVLKTYNPSNSIRCKVMDQKSAGAHCSVSMHYQTNEATYVCFHPVLFSDVFTPAERTAALEHELMHVGKKLTTSQCPGFLCGVVSTNKTPRLAENLVSLHKKLCAKNTDRSFSTAARIGCFQAIAILSQNGPKKGIF